jgi:hypothetical protein
MTLDWCPGIREACGYWRDAPMLQQTFEAMERNLEQNNDACIDCAKTVVEVICRVVPHPASPAQANAGDALAVGLAECRHSRAQTG